MLIGNRQQTGTITDPPATTVTSDDATLGAAANRFSASFSAMHDDTDDLVVRASSPLDVLSNGSIFCQKCQRNQELLERTLKEYEFPDDPSDPEYAIRTKGYRNWKRDLEARYPQVCAECEPKVEEQLRKASYTAKTDHMRRMIDRTKERRHQARRRTLLDYLDLAGKWSWHSAFLLQALWHAVVLGTLFLEQDQQGVADNWAVITVGKACIPLIKALPQASSIIRWAINMSFVAFAWNPRFKQTIRGFTTHILGFRQWYTYQLVIILIRCACLLLSQYNESQGIPALTQLGAHLAISGLMFYVRSSNSTAKP